MNGYIRVLLKEFYTELRLEILDCHKMVSVDEVLLEKLLKGDESNSYEEQY